jgi:1-acyl-sn-glycerol-3-phosphate acyltransferase
LEGILYGVEVICHHAEILRRHRGFIFANHQSYLDALALLSVLPVRFLAAAELRTYPVVNWIATAISTIYVQREERAARQQARTELLELIRQEPEPPIVIFPEGKLGPGDQPLPLRYGAFALAIDAAVPYLLCAIHCRPLVVTAWRGAQGERLGAALWRLACYTGPVQVVLEPLVIIAPPPGAEAAPWAEAAHHILRGALLTDR